MPLYEYRCEEDGSLVTLLRSMAEADEPVEDPEGLDRTFLRVHSTFQVDAPTASRSCPPSVDVGVVAGAVAAVESGVVSDGIQRSLEIGLEISSILDANRQPHQAVLDPQFLSDGGINRGVGHDGGVVDERLDATE